MLAPTRSNRLFLCSAGRLCCRALPPRAPARARERRPAERALERADRAADQVGAPPPGAAPPLGTAERERRGNAREADAAMDAVQERRGIEQSKGVDDGGSASSRARSVSVRTRVSSRAFSASSSFFVAGTTEWDNRVGQLGGTTEGGLALPAHEQQSTCKRSTIHRELWRSPVLYRRRRKITNWRQCESSRI
jgi:hypothetical protein